MIRLVSPERELDFDDILIVPQRSDGQSRNNVILERQFTAKHSGAIFTSVPIIASNMYATGTFKMASALSKHRMMTALHKYYKFNEVINFVSESQTDQGLLFFTIGENKNELYKLSGENKDRVLSKNVLINIDVANGYRASFIKFIQMVRNNFHDSIIMAGNVCTPEMTQEIIIAGADIVKIGIGPGCFIKGTKVKTLNGFKKIENIEVGDDVLTHDGTYQKVEATISRLEKTRFININNITCTPNHNFYVIHKQDKEKVNESNLHKFAKWVSAEELSEDYFLVKITE